LFIKPKKEHKELKGNPMKGAKEAPPPDRNHVNRTRQELIAQVSQVVVGEKPITETAKALAEQVKTAMNVDACVLRQIEGMDLVLLGQCGIPKDRIESRLSSNEGLALEMITKKKPLSVFDTEHHAATTHLARTARNDPGKFSFFSYAGAPLMISGRVIGVLGVYMTLTPRKFTDMDLEDLQIVANHVAVALENDRLYREIQEKNRQLRNEVILREKAEKRLMHHAFHDGLTGIPNRSLFTEHIQHSLEHARQGGLSFSVLLLDLDRFKVINESLGHDVGDKLLIVVTGALQGLLRRSDILARIGGDEFSILLEDFHQRTDAHLLVDQVHRVLSRPFSIDGHEVNTSVSFGIVDYDPHYTNAQEILRDAETAMYHAKSIGKGKHISFTPDMRERAQWLFDIETELNKAIEQKEIFLEYQPIILVNSGSLAGFEALARWNHPVHGLIQPSDFVRVAEETDRIEVLGEQILSLACRQAGTWKSVLPPEAPFFISVNISARQLASGNLPRMVLRILNETGLEPGWLCLELTETTLLQRPSDTIDQLNHLRDLGVKIFIDDFGTGYSSLSYLNCLPVDLMKIDQSFISQIGLHSGEKELIPPIVNLAHSLGLPVIAEGVETLDQLNYLQQLDVDFAQGHAIYRPITAEKTNALCRRYE